MNTILLTSLYNIFVKNLWNETAEGVVNFIDHKFEKDMESKLEKFATKEDLYKTRVELKDDIHNSKVDLIKWIVTLWVAQALIILGLYLKK